MNGNKLKWTFAVRAQKRRTDENLCHKFYDLTVLRIVYMGIIIRWMKTFTSFYALTKTRPFFRLSYNQLLNISGWKKILFHASNLIVKCLKCVRIALSHHVRVHVNPFYFGFELCTNVHLHQSQKWSAITPRLRNFHVTAARISQGNRFAASFSVRPFVKFIVSGPWLLVGLI